MADSGLAGLRVLVVEDEFLVSALVEDVLTDERCTIVGPFARVSIALEAARTEQIDIAVLDVNVGGEKIYPVADMLAARGVPFVLLSGYGQHAVPKDRSGWQVCSKPFGATDLTKILTEQYLQSKNLKS